MLSALIYCSFPETWLSYEISDFEPFANFPYKVFRKDRLDRRVGDVSCLAKNTISLTTVRSPTYHRSDITCFDVFDATHLSAFRIVPVCRPPNTNVEEDDSLTESMLQLFLSDPKCKNLLVPNGQKPQHQKGVEESYLTLHLKCCIYFTVMSADC